MIEAPTEEVLEDDADLLTKLYLYAQENVVPEDVVRSGVNGGELAESGNVVTEEQIERMSATSGRFRHHSVLLSDGVRIGFSIEQQPIMGLSRHLSICVPEGWPPKDWVWGMAQVFDFEGTMKDCAVAPVTLPDGRIVIHLLQKIKIGTVH